MYKYIVILLCFCYFQSFTQKISISGLIKDSTSASIPFASVLVLNAKDSVMKYFALSDNAGKFVIDDVERGDYVLQINTLGFRPYLKSIVVNENLIIGTIVLESMAEQLEGVVVKAERSPISIKNDTVEYHAGAFKIRPGDVVEDLLQKLPGVEVQRDGSIKAYGKDVKNVMVDGKEFFGKDTRMATKNLEADAVDKVQVYDKKSEVADFTGVDDGQRETTINLKLKDGKKNGHFGTINGGLGNNDRFTSKFMLNRFSPKTRLSIIGMGNNINEQGFSFQDYIEFMGGIGAFMSGGRARVELSEGDLPMSNGQVQGVQRSLATGLNLNHYFSNKTEMNVSFLGSNLKNELLRNAQSQSINDNFILNTSENEMRKSKWTNNTLNITLKSQLDSFNRLTFRAGASMGNNELHSSKNLSTSQSNLRSIDNRRNLTTKGELLKLNTNATWLKKFHKKGRAYTLNLTANKGNNDKYGDISSYNNLVLAGINDSLIQNQKSNDNNLSYNGKTTFTEPIGKLQYLQFAFNAANARNNLSTEFYDIINKSETVKNDLLSKLFDRNYTMKSGSLQYMRNLKKYNFNAQLAYQSTVLGGNENNGETVFKNKYFHAWLPSAFLQYQFGLSHNLNLDYTTTLQEPSIQQLQPIVNNNDPINTYIGNPKLRPEYIHELNAQYLNYDQFTFSSLFANASIGLTKNKITDEIFIDSLLFRTLKPINVSSEKYWRTSIDYSTPIRPLKISTKLKLRNRQAFSTVFINDKADNTQANTHSAQLSFENRKKEIIDFQVGYKFSTNYTNHSINENLNQKFNENNFFLNGKWNITDNWLIESDFDYKSYSQTQSINLPNILLWKSSLTTYFLPNKKLKVSLNVFDILNKNNGIRRNNALNYFETETSNVLGRYFLLQLNYSLRGFEKKKEGLEMKFEN